MNWIFVFIYDSIYLSPAAAQHRNCLGFCGIGSINCHTNLLLALCYGTLAA